MGRGVAAAKKQTYKKFSRIITPTIYTKLSKSRKNRNLKEQVTQKMSLKLHTSPKELEKQLVFYEELFKDNEQAYDLKQYFKLTDDEVKLFRSRKIPASVEKKRLTKLRKEQELEEKEIQKQKIINAKKVELKEESKNKKEIKVKTKKDTVEDSSKTKSTTKSKKTSKSTPTKKVTKTKKSSNSTTKNKTESPKNSSKTSSKTSVDDKKTSKKNNKKKSRQTTLFDF